MPSDELIKAAAEVLSEHLLYGDLEPELGQAASGVLAAVEPMIRAEEGSRLTKAERQRDEARLDASDNLRDREILKAACLSIANPAEVLANNSIEGIADAVRKSEAAIRADEQVRLAGAVARTVSSIEAEIRADQDRKTRAEIKARARAELDSMIESGLAIEVENGGDDYLPCIPTDEIDDLLNQIVREGR